MLTVIGLWAGIALLCCGGAISEKPLTPGERAEAERLKEQACNTMDRLKAAGGFTKIEPGYSGVTHAYVGSGFYATTIDGKETALKAVALCHVDLQKRGQLGLVVVHDGMSGKRIGTFDLASGLDLE